MGNIIHTWYILHTYYNVVHDIYIYIYIYYGIHPYSTTPGTQHTLAIALLATVYI
jgi:hypothetical protein